MSQVNVSVIVSFKNITWTRLTCVSKTVQEDERRSVTSLGIQDDGTGVRDILTKAKTKTFFLWKLNKMI